MKKYEENKNYDEHYKAYNVSTSRVLRPSKRDPKRIENKFTDNK